MSSKTLNLASHIHSFQSEPTSRPCTWGRMSSLKGYPSPQTLQFGSNVHITHADTTSQTLYLESHVHSLQGDPPSQTLHLGSHVHSLQGDPLSQTP